MAYAKKSGQELKAGRGTVHERIEAEDERKNMVGRCLGGIGKPEPLSGDLQGEYSRRISKKDSLVFHMENGRLCIAHCRDHYENK